MAGASGNPRDHVAAAIGANRMKLFAGIVALSMVLFTPVSAQTTAPADASALLHLPLFSGVKTYNATLDRIVPKDPTKTYITGPKYMLVPGPNQMAALYPLRAREERVNGLGIVECQWDADGYFRNCRAIAEAPVGYGFGEATRQAFEGHVRIDVSQVNVSPADGRVRLTNRWQY